MHGDEVERWRHTDAPASCCCVSAEPGGIRRRAGVLICPPQGRSCVRYVLTAACTSACAQRVQPRATRSTSYPRPARCWPGRCVAAARPAALCVGLHLPGREQVRLPALELMRPRTMLALSTSTHSHHTTVHHCSQCWSFAHSRSAYRLGWAPAAALVATAERRAACACMCMCVCVHCGQLEPAVPPEKTALNFNKTSANASQNAKNFLRCAASPRRTGKK